MSLGAVVLRAPRVRAWFAPVVMLLLTAAVYVRTDVLLEGKSLIGSDYFELHMRRLGFAQDALFSAGHSLPGWNPRELLGAPFAANLQSFPWIPTRLILLFFDPLAAYAVGVWIAAILAALFTYLFCRRLGISETGAAVAGWTFSCSGFFASRVMAGHLPLLEAYPALPLLLWLSDRVIGNNRKRDLVALAVACAAIAVAGHPQIPVYAIGGAALYVVWIAGGWRRMKALATMALGVGVTLAVWWPMLLLLGRSTRVLRLAPPGNDIAMSFHRLAALVVPGVDGWPSPMSLEQQNPFLGYPTPAYFWDTTSYVGILPLLVILLLLVQSLATRQWPTRRCAFLTVIGGGALLFSLRIMTPIRGLIPGTLLRSPARLLYISSFAAAVALGFGVSFLLRSNTLSVKLRWGILALALVAHALDLGGFASRFVQTTRWPALAREPEWTQQVQEGRLATSYSLSPWYRARFDDVGILDSILLAHPYRAVLGLARAPRDLNIQNLDGSLLPARALQAAGVRFVVSESQRPDLPLMQAYQDVYVYRVPDTWPRSAFFPKQAVDFASEQDLLDRFLSNPRSDRLQLSTEKRDFIATVVNSPSAAAKISYSRPSSDEIVLENNASEDGYVHVLEAYDPGWSATVDGASKPVYLANGYSMAIPVDAGNHSVRLRYQTPGRKTGWFLSAVSLGLFACLLYSAKSTSQA